jgi:hypothetical protein
MYTNTHKFTYKALDHAKAHHSEPDGAQPNQAPHRQIVTYTQTKKPDNRAQLKFY